MRAGACRLALFSAGLFGAVAQAPQPFVAMPSVLSEILANSPTPEKHQIETMPGGVALLDFDNDGRLDIFLANASARNRLYRNLGNWKFEDVTAQAGVEGSGYSTGVATADFDNDGHTDLVVTGVGFTTLYRNRGGGRFEDITKKAGIPQTPWPIAAGWFDFDNDGKLDLFLVSYVIWNPANEPFCGDKQAGFRTYCHPKYYQGLPNTLLRNNGDGTFTDVSASTGIAGQIGKGMAVAFADYNDDGRMDVFVTNDTQANFLFRNDGSKFTEAGYQAGVAINDDGKILSSMGADFRDVDNDGRPDLFTTALANETWPLYRNLGKGLFQDLTYRSRIGPASLPHSGWGNGIFDFDNDGWKDIFIANGDVQDNTERFSNRESKQQNQLLLNGGDGTFHSVAFGDKAQHRGVAFGDLDGDGRVDAVVTRLGQTPVLYRNTLGVGNHWLRLRLHGTRSNRDAIGAKVHMIAGGKPQWNHVTTSVGYASSSETAVHFGLGPSKTVELIEITWPAGGKTVLKDTPADQVVEVTEPVNSP